jgi:hypothetical protein
MQILIYRGPFEAVEIPAAGIVAVHGQPVEVPDAVAESLLRQGWTPAKAPKQQKPEEE